MYNFVIKKIKKPFVNSLSPSPIRCTQSNYIQQSILSLDFLVFERDCRQVLTEGSTEPRRGSGPVRERAAQCQGLHANPESLAGMTSLRVAYSLIMIGLAIFVTSMAVLIFTAFRPSKEQKIIFIITGCTGAVGFGIAVAGRFIRRSLRHLELANPPQQHGVVYHQNVPYQQASSYYS
jgi:hypothetical protein